MQRHKCHLYVAGLSTTAQKCSLLELLSHKKQRVKYFNFLAIQMVGNTHQETRSPHFVMMWLSRKSPYFSLHQDIFQCLCIIHSLCRDSGLSSVVECRPHRVWIAVTVTLLVRWAPHINLRSKQSLLFLSIPLPLPLLWSCRVDPCFLTSYGLAWSTTSGSVTMLHLIVRLVFVFELGLKWGAHTREVGLEQLRAQYSTNELSHYPMSS